MLELYYVNGFRGYKKINQIPLYEHWNNKWIEQITLWRNKEINLKQSRFSAPYFIITLPLLPVKRFLMYDLKGRRFRATKPCLHYFHPTKRTSNSRPRVGISPCFDTAQWNSEAVIWSWGQRLFVKSCGSFCASHCESLLPLTSRELSTGRQLICLLHLCCSQKGERKKTSKISRTQDEEMDWTWGISSIAFSQNGNKGKRRVTQLGPCVTAADPPPFQWIYWVALLFRSQKTSSL